MNQCYEEGLYYSGYLAFCAHAAKRIPRPSTQLVPRGFDRITVDRVTFSYPDATEPALREAMGRAADAGLLATAAASRADTVIEKLAHGALVDRRFMDGAELSGGQWQRIAVARIIEQGDHAQLMKLDGQYAELYTLQASQHG